MGTIYKLRGKVKVDYGTYTIYADRATYNSDTGEVEGEGNLLLEGGPNNEHIEAERGKYNLQNETGRFEEAVGSVGFRLKRPQERVYHDQSVLLYRTGGGKAGAGPLRGN